MREGYEGLLQEGLGMYYAPGEAPLDSSSTAPSASKDGGSAGAGVTKEELPTDNRKEGNRDSGDGYRSREDRPKDDRSASKGEGRSKVRRRRRGRSLWDVSRRLDR